MNPLLIITCLALTAQQLVTIEGFLPQTSVDNLAKRMFPGEENPVARLDRTNKCLVKVFIPSPTKSIYLPDGTDCTPGKEVTSTRADEEKPADNKPGDEKTPDNKSGGETPKDVEPAAESTHKCLRNYCAPLNQNGNDKVCAMLDMGPGYMVSNPCQVRCAAKDGTPEQLLPMPRGTACEYGYYPGICKGAYCAKDTTVVKLG